MVKVAAIAAMNDLRVIGDNQSPNGLPWHVPADLARFKELTKDHIVVMGRTTWESIGKRLPYRHNIVLTSNPERLTHTPDDHAPSFERVLQWYRSDERTIWVIGGAQIYAATMKYWQRLYLTQIDGFHHGDVHMPYFEDRIIRTLQEERFEEGIFRTFLMRAQRP